jgi:hypothetical protein
MEAKMVYKIAKIPYQNISFTDEIQLGDSCRPVIIDLERSLTK